MPSVLPVRITVLGSGTSVGVPTIGCSCRVCQSNDPRDKRLRPSILVSYSGAGKDRNVLIDTTPDLRQQALRAGMTSLDAVFYTHAHADHIMGLDDIRPFNYRRSERIPVYGDSDTVERLLHIFPYAFQGETKHPGGVPRVSANPLDDSPVCLFGLPFTPVPVLHGPHTILGFRFGRAAYVTDNSGIPESSVELLGGLDVLFLDALRREPHPMHSTLDEALAWVKRLKPKQAFLTHICHDLPHEETNATLPPNVRLAHDGLSIQVQGEQDV